jgi:NADH:ubiquinone oxidoreductase subunit F (NADH-binding)/(2Fe-2S) ferredoxin/ferredoxin
MGIVEAFRAEIDARAAESRIGLLVTGCHGFCEREPSIVVQPEGIFYGPIDPEDVAPIVERTALKGQVVSRLAYRNRSTSKPIPLLKDIPFYRRQFRLLTENNLRLDPERIEDYIVIGGYAALSKALFEMTAENVIDVVRASGLRGRGGAGFPTGMKWEMVRRAVGHSKIVVCNANEGDPGAYMARSLLEGNPHSILEGLIIGAYAVGASEGYIYVRQEDPLAVKNILQAVAQASELGLLGTSILGSEFHLEVHVVQGAGAFVSGEETALLASIEGRRAYPRQGPPYPNEAGLWGRPTMINNVETWANVPPIIDRGPQEFASIGTATSKGTKIFSLVGQVQRTGLVEVPMGLALREIIEHIGGGVRDGRTLKAVQLGGPSGGCLPADRIDLPIDFDTLSEAGAIMGSGGLIIMDEGSCMVDMARFFLSFLSQESCGKCAPCRLGTRHLLDILNRLTEGRGEDGDIERMESLAGTLRSTSLCGLGRTAANPVLNTLRYFRDEYLDHIRKKECAAGVCKNLTVYSIDPKTCIGCGLCLENCPVGAVSGARKSVHAIEAARCIKCGACFDVCPPRVHSVHKRTGSSIPAATARPETAKS